MSFQIVWRSNWLLSLLVFASFLSANPPLIRTSGHTEIPLTQFIAPLASQIVDNAGQIGCQVGKCRILVINFVFAEGGGTSPFGMQLADALAVQLSTGEKAFSVVNRDALRKLAQRELLSVDSQTYVPNSRWLASQLRADAVVIGEILKVQDDSLELSVRIFRSDDSRNKVLSVKGELHLDLSKVDLNRIDDLSGTPPGSTFNGETLYHAGKDSTYPSCTYMPNPPFTDEARRTSVSGTIVLEAIVATDGRLKNIRVIRGLPAGLNENALKTPATWRCKPATSEGKPVASIVNFQINFRLYSR